MTYHDCESCGAKKSIPNKATKVQPIPGKILYQAECVVCGTTVTICIKENGKKRMVLP